MAVLRFWLVVVLVSLVGFIHCQTPVPSSGSSDNKLLCMAEMVSNIENSCSKPDIQNHYVALENLLKEYLGKCFHTNFTQNRALHVMMPDISPTMTNYLKKKAEDFKSRIGLDVVPTFVPYSRVVDEILFELEHNLTNSHDGWILDPAGIPNIASLKGFMDLTPWINNDSVVAWDDVLPFYQKYSVFGNSTVVLPLDGDNLLLYYRADIFAQHNISVPKTWDDLLAAARKLANQDFNGDNVPDFPVCYDVRSDCMTQGYDLMAIAAPYLQYQGTSQGLFFDPEPLGDPSQVQQAPLVANDAMKRALSIYAELIDLSPNQSPDAKCDTSIYKWFSNGSCAMTVAWGDQFKYDNANDSYVTRLARTAPLPGSYEVYNRTSQSLVNCTADLCPFAQEVGGNQTQGARYLNRAPYAAFGGWVAAVNARSPQEYQNYSYLFFSQLSSPDESWQSILNTGTAFDPYRVSHLEEIQRWVDADFNLNATKEYLKNINAAINNGNVAIDLRIPGTSDFRAIITAAAFNVSVLGSSVIDQAMEQMQQRMLKILTDPDVNVPYLAESYYASISYRRPANLAPPPPAMPSSTGDQSGKSGSGSPNWLPIAIVLPTVGALLLIAAGVVYEVRNNRKHKNLFGKVVPPGAGPDTSILVTDIQDSTALWESLPAEVMDKAVREHHDCIHRLLLKHSGYESATEGDSFILAFHSPKDALLFAMDAQNVLLHVDWPAELLEAAICKPLYVLGMVKETKPKNLQDILDPSEPALPPTTGKLRALTQTLSMSYHTHEGHNPTIPALAIPSSETYTFATACQRAWKEASKDEPNKVLIFRGLRVRMGIHTGIQREEDVSYNRNDARTHYSGDTIIMSKAVSDAAQGGMVLLSEDTYKKLPLERLWDKYLVLHVGEHYLKDTLPSLNLYHAMNRGLEGRLAYLGLTRSISQYDPGVLDAPVGCITIAFLNVVGAQTLLSWNADLAQQALKIFQGVVGEELKKRHGYLVEAVDGLFLAAFQKPCDAILWALDCNEHMIKQDWPEDLLSHELCEELVISAPTKEGEVVNTVVFRGLRLKTGVDTGQVLGEVHAMTGRMTYRGKVMNRAARIASTASTGQVLCSADSWTLATGSDAAVINSNRVTGTSLGQFRLKGVAEKIEIHHCRKMSNVVPARRTSTMLNTLEHWKWDNNTNNVISPEDVLLGGDAIRAAMMSPRSFTRTRSTSFKRSGSDALAQCAIELQPEQLIDD